jgi:O-antigen/teichoic acid export membrane protein
MHRDVASAYLLAGCRVGSWVVVSAVVYRCMGPDAFAMLALVRATVGLLSYTSLGLAPAMVHMLGKADAQVGIGVPLRVLPAADPIALDYAGPGTGATSAPGNPPDESHSASAKAYANGMILAVLVGLVGIVLTIVYAFSFERLHVVPVSISTVFSLVIGIGCGTILRMVSDVPGAVLQVRDEISTDNILQSSGALAWALLGSAAALASDVGRTRFDDLALAFIGANVVTLVLRRTYARRRLGVPLSACVRLLDPCLMWQLLSYGSTVVLGQLAGFLFTPIAYVLINRLISPQAVADYAPAVQIDAGLLLLITGLASVLLPKSAVAHGAGNAKLVRTYYIRGTLLGTGLLALGALAVWPLAPMILKLWLGNPMPRTQAILPWVLLHTVIGGSSMIGCSILMATGKAKPFALSALFTGLVNVTLGILFAGYFHLGLKGIVFGTLIAAVLRSVLWMPWYVLRSLREAEEIELESPIPATYTIE